MEQSTNLRLPYIMPSQAQKHVTHNEAIRHLDAIVQMAVVADDVGSPPQSVDDGERYLVPAGATAEWFDWDDAIAAYQDGAWTQHTPQGGWVCFVQNTGEYKVFHDQAWKLLATLDNRFESLGINTDADETNRLAVKSEAVLLTHDDGENGSDNTRLTINKKDAAASSSLLFQSGYEGRSEIGLTGDDALHIKVSADGVAWVDAISVDPTNGRVAFKSGTRHQFSHSSNGPALSIVPQLGDPTAPENGDVWYNATVQKFRKRENGQTSNWSATTSSTSSSTSAGQNGQFQFNENGSLAGAAVSFDPQTKVVTFDGGLNLPATNGPHDGVIKIDGARFISSAGTYNAFIGENSGSLNASGQGNFAAGRYALNNLTTGSNNFGMGQLAGRFISSGQSNVAIGDSAQTAMATGLRNIAIGSNALRSATGSNGNVALGFQVFFNCTSSYNIGLGYRSGHSLTTGTRNVFLGHESGNSITTGNKNIVIGSTGALPPNLSDTIILATGGGDERLRVDHTGAAQFSATVAPQNYNVANLPSPQSTPVGSISFVNDDVGGSIPAFCDGSNWRRMSDRAIVSAN